MIERSMPQRAPYSEESIINNFLHEIEPLKGSLHSALQTDNRVFNSHQMWVACIVRKSYQEELISYSIVLVNAS